MEEHISTPRCSSAHMKAWPSKQMKTHWQHTWVDRGKKNTVRVSSLVCCHKKEIGKHRRAEERSKEKEVGGCKVSSSMEGKDRNVRQRRLIRPELQQRTLLSVTMWANGEKEAKIAPRPVLVETLQRPAQSSVLIVQNESEEPWSYFMRDVSWCLCYCLAQLKIIYHNRSTWCSGKGLPEQELEQHKRSVSANKEGENSNISLHIYRCSPSHLSLSLYISFSLPRSAFNMPPSPHVNLLLQWHASLGESFLITQTAPIQVLLSYAQRCHSNYEA